MGSNGTYVAPLLTVGVGAAVAGGTAPSKPDEVKGGGNQTLIQQFYWAEERCCKRLSVMYAYLL